MRFRIPSTARIALSKAMGSTHTPQSATTLSAVTRSAARRTAALSLLCSPLVSGLLMTGLATGIATPTAQASPAFQTRPDKVVRMGSRGRTTDISGTITENTLTGLRIKVRGNEQKVDAEDVVSIRWGEVPASYSEGRSMLDRGDYENAVSRLREAAGDASAREVVQAAARLQSAEALMFWGRIDTERFAECAEECDRFLQDYENDRATPRAEWLKARATLLSGDPAAAAIAYKALYEKGAIEPPTPGYSRVQCLEAGLEAANSLLLAGDVAQARPLYEKLSSELGTLLASMQDATPAAQQVVAASKGEADCGEGFCLLAEGKLPQASTFFTGRLQDPHQVAPATLGLAETLQAQGKLREAQIQFAMVSASDHGSRDRVARALVGLAETTGALGDEGSEALRTEYLNDVKARFGDTPAAQRAK